MRRGCRRVDASQHTQYPAIQTEPWVTSGAWGGKRCQEDDVGEGGEQDRAAPRHQAGHHYRQMWAACPHVEKWVRGHGSLGKGAPEKAGVNSGGAKKPGEGGVRGRHFAPVKRWRAGLEHQHHWQRQGHHQQRRHQRRHLSRDGQRHQLRRKCRCRGRHQHRASRVRRLDRLLDFLHRLVRLAGVSISSNPAPCQGRKTGFPISAIGMTMVVSTAVLLVGSRIYGGYYRDKVGSLGGASRPQLTR